MKKLLCAFAFVVILAGAALAAEPATKGALTKARQAQETQNDAGAKLGAGATQSGPGSDLRSIASPAKPQTATGFPAGTLPGSSAPRPSAPVAVPAAPRLTPGTRTITMPANAIKSPEGNVVFSGARIDPIIGDSMLGSKLDRVTTVANSAGYSLVRIRYYARVLDAGYSFYLMRGGRRISTLYFDRGMNLLRVAR